jgi:hypothetical protein
MAKRAKAATKARTKTANEPKRPRPQKDHKRNTSGLVPWKKGNPGRKKGTPNKFTIVLKDAILQAAEKCGRDGKGKDGAVGYLVWLARTEPAVYGRMLEKVMPLQVEVKARDERRMTPQEAVENLKERGIPVPPSLANLAAAAAVHAQRQEDEDYEAELNGEDQEVMRDKDPDVDEEDGGSVDDGDDDEGDGGASAPAASARAA